MPGDETARLDRIERMLREVLSYAVRLEWRLEEAGLLSGSMRYASDELRFMLEHNMERPEDDSEPISIEFRKRVSDYLKEHGKDANVSFYRMEEHFGEHYRLSLIRTLELFALRHQWVEVIERMTTTEHHPLEAKALHRDFYSDERRG
jgi:hypothetical protein